MRRQILKLGWGLVLAVALAGWLGQGDGIGGDVGGQHVREPGVRDPAAPAEETGAEGSRGADPSAEPAGGTSLEPAADPPVRRIVITIDDLPAVSVLQPGTEGQREILGAVREAVLAHGVPAIGFVNESKLYDGDAATPEPRRVALLEGWLDAGLALGNHTFSHPDLHRLPLEDWLADARRGEVVTRRLLAERGEELAWFRHPFLHTGRDLETKAAVEEDLASRGVRVAPVTVDNDDYLFAAAWDRAGERGDGDLQDRLEAAYVPYMMAKVEYYEAQSRGLFDREVPLVLLIHANSINARRFGDLAAALAGRGYRFVPLAEAVADPAYGSADTYTGPAGISWIHRWALTRGVEPAFFRGEPELPSWVAEAARPPEPGAAAAPDAAPRDEQPAPAAGRAAVDPTPSRRSR